MFGATGRQGGALAHAILGAVRELDPELQDFDTWLGTHRDELRSAFASRPHHRPDRADALALVVDRLYSSGVGAVMFRCSADRA